MTTEHLDEPLDPHERAALRRKAIDACTLCDDEGYNRGGPFLVCDHVDRSEINERGMALVRKALEGKPNNPNVLHRRTVADDLRRRAEDEPPELSGNPTLDPEPEL